MSDATSDLIPRLAEGARTWGRAPVRHRIRVLAELGRAIFDEAEAWAERGNLAKGLGADDLEEWIVGPSPVLRTARVMKMALERLDAGRPAVSPTSVGTRPDGRVSVRVFPEEILAQLSFLGIEVEQRMLEGETERSVLARAGRAHHGPTEGGVSLILGAGNVSSIPPLDALQRIYGEGSAALVKLSPVNAWVKPHLERAFAPLIREHMVAFVEGGPEEGARLLEHPDITDAHITGSHHSHDAIVWGQGAEAEDRRHRNAPRFEKPMTSELGNVSPVAIAPFDYSEAELASLVDAVAGMVVNNASFNCNAAKMLVLAEQWAQRTTFLAALGRAFERIPTRLAYYPGAFERYDRLTAGRDGMKTFGARTETHLPWTLIEGLDAGAEDEPLFVTEPFCSILSVTTLPESEPDTFLESAARFMNERLWGRLNATVMVPDGFRRSTEGRELLDRTVSALRYGTVAINQWPAVAYALGSPAWGGHPSATLADIQSGLGWVHNAWLLEGIEKTVMSAPLRMFPRPVWYPGASGGADIGRRLLELEAQPSLLRMLRLGAAVLTRPD